MLTLATKAPGRVQMSKEAIKEKGKPQSERIYPPKPIGPNESPKEKK